MGWFISCRFGKYFWCFRNRCLKHNTLRTLETILLGLLTLTNQALLTRIQFKRGLKRNDPENWTATDYVDIDLGDHGDYITGILLLMGETVYLFLNQIVFTPFSVLILILFKFVTLSNNVGSWKVVVTSKQHLRELFLARRHGFVSLR